MHAMITYHAGDDAVMSASSTPPAVSPAPAMSSGGRVPRRAIIRPAIGAEQAMTAAIGTRNRPASSGR